jgi:CubicO group peptidase (beta-lactamase class C family)
MIRSRHLASSLVLALVAAGCSVETTGGDTTTVPPSPSPVTTVAIAEGTWLGAGTPESRGMDSGALADLVTLIDSRYPDIDAVAIVRNGTLVLDAAFYPHEADKLHQVYSVTKSVVSTLIGIAIEHGLVEGLDVSIVNLLSGHVPVEVDDLKASMTLEDVLTMSTGLDCRDSYLYRWEGLGEMRASGGWAAHVLALPMREEPGTRFEYCNGASHLLSTILTEATGGTALEFGRETLFGPLGIEDVTWREGPDSVSTGYAGIALRPADMAKIGWLYLQDGAWNGEQLVPSGWTDAATQRHVDAGTAAAGYGYQWWVEDDYAAAIGYGGQYILVVPEHDLVVAFVSGLSRNQDAPEDLLQRYIIPAILSDGPLPPDPGSTERLEMAIAAAAEAPPDEGLPIAAMAEEIDGVPHVFAENSGGFEWFVLDFEGDMLTMALEDVDGPIEVMMAFDGQFHPNEAWGRTWAFRPEWTSDNTLTIDFRMVGDAARGEFEFVFGDDHVDMSYRELVFATSVQATADRSPQVLGVPDIAAPRVDGVIEPNEWSGAVTTTMDDGSEVFWAHSAGDLYVAVETERGGSKNLLIAEADRIRILHSSAALGSAEYQLVEGEWHLVRDFAWCCRDGIDGSGAGALFAAEGWLASMASDGPHEQVEFRVEWPQDGALVALSHVPASSAAAFWPLWLGDAAKGALTGARQEVETFDVSRWVKLARALG